MDCLPYTLMLLFGMIILLCLGCTGCFGEKSKENLKHFGVGYLPCSEYKLADNCNKCMYPSYQIYQDPGGKVPCCEVAMFNSAY